MTLAEELALKYIEPNMVPFNDGSTGDFNAPWRGLCDLAINEALERAAQECEINLNAGCKNVCHQVCADRIRALKSESVK